MKVRAIYEWEIDPEAYVAAAIEAEVYGEGELDPGDLETVANWATGYTDAEDRLPRWARSSVKVLKQEIKIADEIDGSAGCICGGKW
jgi:hypothetical protein